MVASSEVAVRHSNLIPLCGLFIESRMLIDGPCFTLPVTGDPLQLRVRNPRLVWVINNRVILWSNTSLPGEGQQVQFPGGVFHLDRG